jgi:hypothetical protein
VRDIEKLRKMAHDIEPIDWFELDQRDPSNNFSLSNAWPQSKVDIDFCLQQIEQKKKMWNLFKNSRLDNEGDGDWEDCDSET